MSDLDQRFLRTAPITRRTLLRAAVVSSAAGVAAWLAACGGTPTATAPAPSAAPAASTAPAASAAPAASSASSAASAAASASRAASAAPSAAASAAASTAPAAGGTPKRGGSIKVGLTSDTGNLDPMLSSFLVDREVFYNLYDSLVAIDSDLKIIPSLAEKWDISADGKTYTFTLRKGVKYHDGTDFNAASVKWNIERYLNDKTSRRASEINSIQTVEVVDDSTVKFNLKAAFAPLLANLVDRAGMMVSQKAAEAAGADFTRKPVGAGTGPFKFVEWVSGDHITLERNTTYWKKGTDGQSLPYLDKITYRTITDETVRLTNLKTGDLDADFNVPAKDYAATKSGGEINFQETTALSFSSIYVNTQAEPFNKKEFRQAIAYLIDREQIAKTIFFDLLKVGYGPIPPSSWAYDPSFKPYSVDVNKAKELLKAGGKPDGFTFEMKIGAGSPVTLQLTQLIKDQLAKANIIMNITQLEAAKTASDAQAGNFQAEYYGWSGRIDPDGNIYNQMRGGGSLNDGKYSNPQVDDLLDKARASTDQNERKNLYQQAQKLIVDDAPFIFYGFGTALLLTRPAIQNVKVYADQIMRFEAAWLK